MNDYKQAIGAKIREYRVSKNLSLEQFSELLNVHPHTISKYENGEMGNHLDTFMKFCQEVPGLIECLSAVLPGVEPEEQQLNLWWSALSLKEKKFSRNFSEFEKRERD